MSTPTAQGHQGDINLAIQALKQMRPVAAKMTPDQQVYYTSPEQIDAAIDWLMSL